MVFVKPTDSDALKHMNLQAINDGIDTQKKTVSGFVLLNYVYDKLALVCVRTHHSKQ